MKVTLSIFIFQHPLDQQSTNDGSGLAGALPGGQLLSAALGVTRAVTQFLGSALQVSIDCVANMTTATERYQNLFEGRRPYNTNGMVRTTDR